MFPSKLAGFLAGEVIGTGIAVLVRVTEKEFEQNEERISQKINLNSRLSCSPGGSIGRCASK
jgi:hypothetical protein